MIIIFLLITIIVNIIITCYLTARLAFIYVRSPHCTHISINVAFHNHEFFFDICQLLRDGVRVVLTVPLWVPQRLVPRTLLQKNYINAGERQEERE